METCPLCNYKASIKERDHGDLLIVNCPKCGRYEIKEDVLSLSQEIIPNWKQVLSYWIRNHQRGNDYIPIDKDLVEKIKKEVKLPTPFEQANNLLLWLGRNAKTYSSEIQEDLDIIASVIGSMNEDDVKLVADYLQSESYIKHNGFKYSVVDGKRNPPKDHLTAYITIKGWAKVDELNKPTSNTKIAFMAMKYNEPDLEDIFRNNIIKTVQQTGFEIDLLKDVLKAGSIDDQLRVQIRRAKFLVVDLTHGNNGAYWEAGYAEGLSKPVIYLCKKSVFDNPDTKPHFDTNHLATVTWEKETIAEDMKNLKAIIRNTFPTEALMDD